MSTDALTTTSYAILGLLGIQPWTTYELAQQMERSLKHFWPRAQSRIYEEPKRLATLGLAKASREHVGRRPRTTYTITAKGRRALQRGSPNPAVDRPSSSRPCLKVFYGEQATKADVLANIDAIATWADRQNRENVAFARLYRDSPGPFPQRLAGHRPDRQVHDRLRRHARHMGLVGGGEVAGWPDEPAAAEPNRRVFAEIAERPVEPAPLPPVGRA